MRKIVLNNITIGDGRSCFIIAEAGVNHNGDFKLAKKLVDAAKEAGVDAVKFQTFNSSNLVTATAATIGHQIEKGGRKKTQLEMLKELELTLKDFSELKKYCDQKKITFLSTAHSSDVLDFLAPLVPVFKIGSGDITNLPFLEKVSRYQKPIILSTGMATIAEIKEALKVIKKRNKQIIITHCTTHYPCPLEEVNLKAMLTLQREFNLPVGYSDHTLEPVIVAVAAVAMGSVVLEKHFTLNKNLPGPDHKASLNPEELKEMVKAVRKTEIILGTGEKKTTKTEKKLSQMVRKSIIARKDILKGDRIAEDMIIIKRPGTGIESRYLDKFIGKRAKKNIKKDKLITWKDI